MTRAKKYLGFDDLWFMLPGIPIIAFAVTVMMFGLDAVLDWKQFCYVIGLIFTISYWFAFREIFIQYHKKFPDYDFTGKRLFYISSRMLIVYFVVKLVVGALVHQIFPETVRAYDHNALSAQISIVLVILLVFFIYEGIYYFNRSRMIEIEKNKLEKITAEQRLDTLKNQVNPHFLFNSLNTLVTMIPEEPDMAITFVQKLSKTYRNILEFRNEKLIPIKQELKALDAYIYLLKTRFQGKIHIYNSISEDVMDEFILPISLQILIENAVKHNITSQAQPLKIELSSDNGYIVVKNNLQKKTQKYNSTKLGLANIRSRYKILANQDISIEEGPEYFSVKLPIIKNQLHAHSID